MGATSVKGRNTVTFVTHRRASGRGPVGTARRDQDSFDRFVSSITMSLNSLDSKISPHSLHSTNSESSSRATIWTRGCLHGAILLFFSGSGDGEDGVINPGFGFPVALVGHFARNWRYFRPASPVVKSFHRSFDRCRSSKSQMAGYARKPAE